MSVLNVSLKVAQNQFLLVRNKEQTLIQKLVNQNSTEIECNRYMHGLRF